MTSISDITSETKTQSMSKAFLNGRGLFICEVSGYGIVFVSAVGSMMILVIVADHSVTVDNGHLVTQPAHLQQESKRDG